VNLPMKLMFLYMERRAHVLDTQNPHHLGACQILGLALLKFADAMFVSDWDTHTVRRARGPAVGKPRDLRAQHPHPTGMRTLPPGRDMVLEYERATGRQLRSQPSWAAARDPLHGQPQRQSQRSAAVLAVWGAMPDVWRDVLHNLGRARFIPGFRVFLQFV
jgi:hypothetical protein